MDGSAVKHADARFGMSAPFLTGNRIYLRAVTEADVTERYVAWLSDSEVTRFLGWRAFPSTPRDIAEYVNRPRRRESLFLAICLKKDDLHIGNIHLGPIDWTHRRAELSMILGDRSCWGKGYMAEAFELLAHHAFNALNLNKLKAGTEEGNAAAIRLFQKTGWTEEARLRREFWREGKFRDLVYFAKFNPADSSDAGGEA